MSGNQIANSNNRNASENAMNLSEQYYLWIQQSLDGSIAPADQARLNAWLAADPANAALAAQYRRIWDASANWTPELPAVDEDAAFERLLGRIHEVPAAKTPARKVNLWPVLARVAAGLALLAIALFTYRQFNNTPAAALITASSDNTLHQLNDGTKVWLRKDASLRVPAAFSAQDRRVQLEGEAFFEVQHDPAHPFRIELPQQEMVEVLGTKFVIRATPGADQSSVLVYSGKVRFTPVAGKAFLTLTRGERGVWQRTSAQLSEQAVSSFADLRWHSGKMEFKDAAIREIIRELEDTYSIQVTLEVPEMANCTYSSTLPQENPEKVLEALAEVHGMQLKKTGEKAYVLSGGSPKSCK